MHKPQDRDADVKRSPSVTGSGDRSAAIGGDARGSAIITGADEH